MPTFPTYRGTLPKSLGLFKPTHYLLLAYWVYFRPSALISYLHQAVPELFDPKNPIRFFRKWSTSAFRNLFLMIPLVCTLITLLLGGVMTGVIAWCLHVPVNWGQWRDGVMLGVALGVTIGMALGMAGRVIGGIPLSTIVGIAYGMTVGVVGGVSLSVALGIDFPNIMTGALVVGTLFGIVAGTAFTLDIEIGIALSLAFAVMATLSFGAEFIMSKVVGIHLGALQVRGAMSAAFVIGAFRLLFYPVQWGLAFASFCRMRFHPVYWDELTILPLPCTKRLCLRMLRHNEQEGLHFLAQVGRNHFRRAMLQAVLYQYLHKHPTPLRFLYDLLASPAMDEYFLIPVTSRDWEQHVSVRRVFLGELALHPVEATQDPRFHRSAWWLNMRKRKSTPLTQFAGMLHELLDKRNIEEDKVDLKAYQEIYSNLTEHLHGEEIALSYTAMAAFLSYISLPELPSAVDVSSNLNVNLFFHEAIQPAVLMSLSRLGQIGGMIAIYQRETTPQAKLTALARALGDLNELNKDVSIDVLTPEQYILRRIIHQWEQLIIVAMGDLGKSEQSSSDLV
ncbi:membrane protein [Candidatus Vecturithrix granuli]|uniref:Membrane protein n=1 Tax=Vecturithrix granuli TaxID=1499967 RepID=A0A081C9D0_VECG1|nr:membrane protein [Candidatus Vecturithrix granuli]